MEVPPRFELGNGGFADHNNDGLKRDFYAEMARVEGWSTRDLRERIDSMLYERTALSKKPEAFIRQELTALRDKGELSPALVFRDPYVLDSLDLADASCAATGTCTRHPHRD